jgi:hypothetical protein
MQLCGSTSLGQNMDFMGFNDAEFHADFKNINIHHENFTIKKLFQNNRPYLRKNITYTFRQKGVDKISQHFLEQYSAKFRDVVVTKFRELNFDFIIISYFGKVKMYFRIHPIGGCFR